MGKYRDKVVVSIITVVYNNDKHIEGAINSVLSQDYQNIEYIVVDGCSNDNTLDIINRYKDQISVVISEPDDGIYDALNKGVNASSGDVVGFLNSDDLFENDNIISSIATLFNLYNLDVVYGDLDYISPKKGNIIRHWKSGVFSTGKLKYGWMPPHPAFYVRKDFYTKGVSAFNPRYKISSDYDNMLEILSINGINVYYLSRVFVKMRLGGASNKSIFNIFLKMREDFSILQSKNIGGLLTVLLKNLRKLHQFFIRSR